MDARIVMETDRKEVVYAITIQAKDALEQYRQLVAANNDAKAALTANNKALRENQAALDATAKSLKADGTNADEVARKTADLTAKRKELNRTNADLKASIAGLSSQERELKNDISGTTEAGLRFRDKMSEAFAGQLNQKLGVLQTQLVAAQKAANDAAASLGRGSPEAAKTAAAVKSLEAEITKLKGVTDGGFESMRSKLRQANAELNQAVITFGRGSKEVAALAARVDELNDELEITKQQAAGADLEGKFELMGNAASKVTNIVGGVTAGLQLLGAEKGTIEEVGKAILALQQAQAIAEGLKSLGSLGKTLTALGASLGLVTTATQASAIASGEDAVAKTAEGEAAVVATGANKAFVLSLATNPIFLAVTAIVAITAAVVAFGSEVKDATVDYKALTDQIRQDVEIGIDFDKSKNRLELLRIELNNALAGGPETEDAIRERNATIAKGLDDQLADVKRGLEKITNLNRARSAEEIALLLDLEKQEAQLQDDIAAHKIQSEIDVANFRNKVRDDEKKEQKNAADEEIKEAKRKSEELAKLRDDLRNIESQQAPKTEANDLANVNAQFDELEKRAQGNADILQQIAELRVSALNDILATYAQQQLDAEQRITENQATELQTRTDQINAYAESVGAASQASEMAFAESEAFRRDAIQQTANVMQAFSQLAEHESAAQKALATTAALMNTYLGVTQVLANKTTLPEPFASIQKFSSIAIALATGLSAVKNIQGLAEGGIVRPSWGTPITRSNGDNVLVNHADGGHVTLRTNEAVLTEADQAAVKQRTGYSVFELARGEPVRALIGQSSFAIGGMVPRPSSSQVQQAAATQAFREFDPTVVADIVEISKHLKRLDVRENINTSG